MSSALSSAKNRRANNPPVIQPSKTPVDNRQLNQVPQPQPLPQQQGVPPVGGGLSLQQVIEIYGRRLNQLEAFMNKSQTQQADLGLQPKTIQATATGPSLSQIQDIVDAKIRDYNDLLVAELQPLRDGLESSKTAVVSEADFSEFHGRCQMLAEEIYQIKDLVLKLQSFTMSVNQKLVEKAGLIAETQEPEGGLTIPLPQIQEEETGGFEENV